VLEAHSQIEAERRRDPELILKIQVDLSGSIAVVLWAEALLIRLHYSTNEIFPSREPSSRVEGPDAAVILFDIFIEMKTACIRTEAQVVAAAELRGKVVNVLKIILHTCQWILAGVTDVGGCVGSAEGDDGNVVAIDQADQHVAAAESETAFATQSR
jgi:hypothetical protein